jgi:hypothetical protein
MTDALARQLRAAAPAEAGARGRGRRFYTGMGVVAVLVVVVGFSGPMPGDVGDGSGRRAFSPQVRLHAALFGGWLALFIAQTRLVAMGRTALHRRLGIVASVLAVAMLAVGVPTAIAAARRGWPFDGDPLGNLVHPLGDLVSFTVLVGVALWYRRKPDVHKRLMLLATAGALMNAPLAHMHARLPAPLNANPLLFLLPMVLLLSASAVYDRVTRGRIHPVSLWGAVLLFAWGNVRELLIRPSSAWHQFAAWLVG